ncbi:lactate racemase domain-containing protein [Paenibacillus piri]|uniref:DUF2088 domain-containing protein n=1 Tax=Paenibacillus piri TaxID=2547395 RepID=A0A4R5KQ41_9BACL|nr:lactate racemase domain-containing protein [Paenibacillus piri]TDF97078.1 DUF2088 domain-containing protein [Paenibacillus piri]
MFEHIQVKVEGGFDIPFPRMIPVEQKFAITKVDDISETVHDEFLKNEVQVKIRPGMKVAVAVGSRGINNLQEIVTHVVKEIKRLGGEPFIVPAMGSHGGATAEGQIQVLADYGIVEQHVGCPIRASMETVLAGQLPNGIPLYFDKHAYESDAVVVVCRVKPHTDFKGEIESGIQKMIVIGLGKHKGATFIHSLGFDQFHSVIPEAGKLLIEKTNVALAVAVIENARDETAEIVAVPSEAICEVEPGLLVKAKAAMPKFLLDEIDVLVLEEIGKNISGSGMDPNIVGRTGSGLTEGFQAPPIQKMVVRDLTEKTHGNAAGIGIADIITTKVFNKIDFGYTYANCITSTALLGAKIPVVLRSDKEALAVAVKTCNRITPATVKIVWIKNTLEMEHIYISETYLDLIKGRDDIAITGDPVPIEFDSEGNLTTALF